MTNDVYYTFKISARNDVGYSLLSETITILCAKKPDPPEQLVDVPSVYNVNGQITSGITTAYQIGLEWIDGPFNGGSPVLDYRLSYKINEVNNTVSDIPDWTVYSEATNDIPFTVIGLTPSIIYDFRVESRNLVNHSDTSEVTTIRAA